MAKFCCVDAGNTSTAPRKIEQTRLVSSVGEAVDNIRRFHSEASAGESLPIPTGRYFAYDPVSGWFAPAKFAGIAGMSVSLYQHYSENESPSIFDGNRTQNALRSVWGGECSDAGVLRRFKEWLQQFAITYKDNMEVFCAGPIEEPPVLETFCKEIRGVKQDRSSGIARNYKPLVLLAAVRTLLEGLDLGYVGALQDNFKVFARAIGCNDNFMDPYFRLTRGGLWEHLTDRPR